MISLLATLIAIVAPPLLLVGLLGIFAWCLAGAAMEVQAYRERGRMAERPWRR